MHIFVYKSWPVFWQVSVHNIFFVQLAVLNELIKFRFLVEIIFFYISPTSELTIFSGFVLFTFSLSSPLKLTVLYKPFFLVTDNLGRVDPPYTRRCVAGALRKPRTKVPPSRSFWQWRASASQRYSEELEQEINIFNV